MPTRGEDDTFVSRCVVSPTKMDNGIVAVQTNMRNREVGIPGQRRWIDIFWRMNKANVDQVLKYWESHTML